MYAVKGSWAGQAFALATANDSGGKKSRIRRSKEERKAMVESFIQRYQSSNDGTFPSLNLTHKEVGGSFYTVREIVREIIQENRVLGPARFGSDVQDYDTITEHYPLGSIAAEPQGLLFQTGDKLNFVSNHQEKGSLDLVLGNNGQYTNHQDSGNVQFSSEHQTAEIDENRGELAFRNSENENLVTFNYEEHANPDMPLNSHRQCIDLYETDNGRHVDGIQTSVISEESDKLLAEGSSASETLDADKESESAEACKAKLTFPTKEVVVETFPLRTAVKETDELGSASADSGNLNGTLVNSETKPMELSSGSLGMDKNTSAVRSSDQVDTMGTNGVGSSICADLATEQVKSNGKVIQHREVKPTNQALDILDSSPTKEDTLVIHDGINPIAIPSVLTVKNPEQNAHEFNDAPKRTVYLETSNRTNSKSNDKETPFLAANGNDIRKDHKAVAGRSPPLDRINLQSWERTASKQQPNPLLAIFKAFVGVFIKFWSE